MTPSENPKKYPHHEVFSASLAGHLDSRLHRFLYRPDRLAERYVKPGNRVLDFGCGPGFFTREFAKRVGEIRAGLLRRPPGRNAPDSAQET